LTPPDALRNLFEDKNILIVDDIHTTQGTLRGALKTIMKISRPRRIVIFTMLGKAYNTIF
jgi:pyrimidine operon attenuation protein/uracil phosphoribosyltransferase